MRILVPLLGARWGIAAAERVRVLAPHLAEAAAAGVDLEITLETEAERAAWAAQGCGGVGVHLLSGRGEPSGLEALLRQMSPCHALVSETDLDSELDLSPWESAVRSLGGGAPAIASRSIEADRYLLVTETPAGSRLRVEFGVESILHVLTRGPECARQAPSNEQQARLAEAARSLADWIKVQAVSAHKAIPQSPLDQGLRSGTAAIQKPPRGNWADGLWPICVQPQDHDNVIEFDDTIVTLHDKCPKAKIHLLVLPRARMDFLSSLRREHIPLLELMGERGRAAFEKLSAGTPVPFGYKMGFHALPSMRQLHLHVISNDFISARLKTWHHYNSFATQFFRPLESVIEQLRTTGKVEFDAQEYKTINYMSRAPCCHCGATLDTFPALQKHLLDHFKRSTASSR